jgi:hypothetical protein
MPKEHSNGPVHKCRLVSDHTVSRTSGVAHCPSNVQTHSDSENENGRRRGKRKRKCPAPTDYLVYTNPDKKSHTKPPEQNNCQPGHPARIIVVGKPGCGKRSVMYNILENYDFDFDTITEVHASAKSEEHDVFEDAADYQLWQWDNTTDGESSQPYRLVGIPPISRFEKRGDDGEKLHHLLIMDEPPCEWPSDMRRKVGTLMNYNSTHNNCTIFLVTQHFQNLPVQIREAATHFVFFPTHNRLQCSFMSSKCGVDLESLFRRFCRSKYDSIMVDMTGDGPRIRRNVYEVIEDGEVRNELKLTDVNQSKKKKKVESESESDEEDDYDGRARRTG